MEHRICRLNEIIIKVSRERGREENFCHFSSTVAATSREIDVWITLRRRTGSPRNNVCEVSSRLLEKTFSLFIMSFTVPFNVNDIFLFVECYYFHVTRLKFCVRELYNYVTRSRINFDIPVLQLVQIWRVILHTIFIISIFIIFNRKI